MFLIMLPMILALIAGAVAYRVAESIPGLFGFLDRNRPLYTEASIDVHIQKQLFHLMMVNGDNAAVPRTVPVIGSSSVANGVDAGLLNLMLEDKGVNVENFGLTGLYAYELPLLSEQFLPKGRRMVVFAYNPWMFADTLHPQAIFRRWNTREALRLFRAHDVHAQDLNRFATGAFAEAYPFLRFNQFFSTQIARTVAGTLRPVPYPYDIRPGMARKRYPTLTSPMPLESLSPSLRRLYEESDTNEDTLGWRGLERFLILARERNVTVLTAPAPLMPSSRFRYCQGIDVAGIDRRVCRLAAAKGFPCVDRAQLPKFEDNDFHDPVHMHDAGRVIFTQWLAAHIRSTLGDS